MQFSKKGIFEAVGVPANIENVSKRIFKAFERELENEGDNIIDPTENYPFELQGRFKIADFNFKSVTINLSFPVSDDIDEPLFFGMGIHMQSQPELPNKLITTKSKDLELSVRIAIPEKKPTKFSQVLDLIQIEEPEIQSSFTHELMHAYDDFKRPHETIKGRARYSGIQETRFDIPPLRKFTHYLYYATATENIVRPAEVHSHIKKLGVSRDMFHDFLLSNQTYKMYQEINNFSLDGLISGMSNYMDKVDELLDSVNELDDDKTDEEKIKRALELFYINLSNNIVNNFKHLITTDFFEQVFGIYGPDKQKLIIDFSEEVTKFRNNPLEFFKFEEKKLKRVSSEMLRKLSKLYSLIGDKKKSIKEWDLHQNMLPKPKYDTKFRV
jgi:hypothetical protein